MRLKETEKSKLSERNKQLEGLLGEQKAEIKTLEQNKRKYKDIKDIVPNKWDRPAKIGARKRIKKILEEEK